MLLQDASLLTLKDIERLERVPLAIRLSVGSTYALLRQAAVRNPEQPCFVLAGDSPQAGDPLTTRTFLGKLHQTANLLADLGIGSQDVIALLLPDLLETHLLLWGGQAAGIVCPIPPWLPAPQIIELLQAVKAKVLVAPGPELSHELWQKTELVRRKVKSITMVLQVRGPGKEQDAAYAFDALVEDYPSDLLHTGREIAPDDIAVYFPTRGTTSTPGVIPLTHGNLLYTAWALGLAMKERPEEVLLRGLSCFIQACCWSTVSSPWQTPGSLNEHGSF